MNWGASTARIFALVCLATLLSTGCQRLRPEGVLAADGVIPHERGQAGQIKTLSDAYAASLLDLDSNPLALRLLDSGLALSRTFCNEYMDRLGSSVQRTDAWMKGAALAGTTTAAVMGTAGAGSTAIALAATGFTSLLAGGEIYQSVYLFTPEIGALRQLMNSALDAVVVAANRPEVRPHHTFHSAVLAIQSATNVCQVDGIRRLVNEAVKAGTVTATFEDYKTKLISIADEQVSGEIADALGVKSVSVAQVAAFYWLYHSGLTTEERKSIHKTLEGLTTPLPVDANGAFDNTFKAERQIRNSLSRLSDKAKAELEGIIEKTKVDLAKPATKPGDKGTDAKRGMFAPTRAMHRAPVRMSPAAAPPVGYISVEVK